MYRVRLCSRLTGLASLMRSRACVQLLQMLLVLSAPHFRHGLLKRMNDLSVLWADVCPVVLLCCT